MGRLLSPAPWVSPMIIYGKVRAVISTRGFGYLLQFPELKSTDEVFFHARSVVPKEDYTTMQPGDYVEFDLDPNGPKGARALVVRKLTDKAEIEKLKQWENQE